MAMTANSIYASIASIPYTAGMGITIDEAAVGNTAMTLADAEENQNLVGIVHAGALFTFGETVAGISIGFDTLEIAFPLARNAEIRYLRPAIGPISARAKVPDAELAEFQDQLKRERRAEISVDVRLSNSTGEKVAEMVVHYSFRPTERK